MASFLSSIILAVLQIAYTATACALSTTRVLKGIVEKYRPGSTLATTLDVVLETCTFGLWLVNAVKGLLNKSKPSEGFKAHSTNSYHLLQRQLKDARAEIQRLIVRDIATRERLHDALQQADELEEQLSGVANARKVFMLAEKARAAAAQERIRAEILLKEAEEKRHSLARDLEAAHTEVAQLASQLRAAEEYILVLEWKTKPTVPDMKPKSTKGYAAYLYRKRTEGPLFGRIPTDSESETSFGTSSDAEARETTRSYAPSEADSKGKCKVESAQTCSGITSKSSTEIASNDGSEETISKCKDTKNIVSNHSNKKSSSVDGSEENNSGGSKTENISDKSSGEEVSNDNREENIYDDGSSTSCDSDAHSDSCVSIDTDADDAWSCGLSEDANEAGDTPKEIVQLDGCTSLLDSPRAMYNTARPFDTEDGGKSPRPCDTEDGGKSPRVFQKAPSRPGLTRVLTAEELLPRRSRRSIKNGIQAMKKRGAAEGWLLNPKQVALVKSLEKNGFNTTFLATYKEREVLVKNVKMEDGINDEGFLRELRVLTAVRSTHIVHFFGAIVTPPQACWLVLEQLSGGTLLDWLYGPITYPRSKPKISIKRKLQIGLGIAQGMLALETANPPMMHRDLQPANVLLDSQQRPKITGFRFSCKAEAGWREASTYSSSPTSYMSPEMHRGQAVSPKTDTYSFALVLLEIIEQQPPFADHSRCASDVAQAVGFYDLEPPLPFGVPRRLHRLLEACWSSEPDERPAFKHVGTELRAILADL